MINLNYRIQDPTIIIEAQTGVSYGNQVNGCACSFKEIEGYILPFKIPNEYAKDKFFDPSWWYNQYGGNIRYLTTELFKKDAQETYTKKEIISLIYKNILNDGIAQWEFGQKFFMFIEEVFEPLHLEVLRDLPMWEAWIPVDTLYGKGILTWENCD